MFKKYKTFGNYLVFSNGEVYSLISNKYIKKFKNDRGYNQISLKGKVYKQHRLVAQLFIDNPEKKKEVNHKDGNKMNNDISNLEWCTRLENMQHAYKAGLIVNKHGEGSSRSILTQAQVNYIRDNYKPRHPEFGQCGLGRRFNVTNSCVWRVIHGDNW